MDLVVLMILVCLLAGGHLCWILCWSSCRLYCCEIPVSLTGCDTLRHQVRWSCGHKLFIRVWESELQTWLHLLMLFENIGNWWFVQGCFRMIDIINIELLIKHCFRSLFLANHLWERYLFGISPGSRYHSFSTILFPTPSRTIQLRAALSAVLRGHPDGWVHWFGVQCSTWVTTSRGSTGRSPCNPAGLADEVPCVAAGNMQVARTASSIRGPSNFLTTTIYVF